jgi:CubicO group peptidase (beta-lactamase class C family)
MHLARIVCLLVTVLIAPSLRAAALSSERLESWADAAFGEAQERGRFSGLVIEVVDADGVRFEKGYGYADAGSRQPVLPDQTQSRIGSVSKTVTATAIAKLLESGAIRSLDQPANDVLRRLKLPDGFGRPITLWDLVTHRPGFEDSVFGGARPLDTLAGANLARRIPAIVRPPGSESAYSNFAFTVLGAVIEDVSGQPYADYLQQHLFQPLGMTHTGVLAESSTAALAKPASPDETGELRSWPSIGMSPALVPAGGVISTGHDMARYLGLHLQARDVEPILSPATLQTMHTARVRNHPAVSGVGMSFMVSDWNGRPVIEHWGSWPGYRALLLIVPDLQVGVFIAAAGGIPKGGPEAAVAPRSSGGASPAFALDGPEMGGWVLEELLGKYTDTRQQQRAPIHDAGMYAGTYLLVRRPYETLEALRNVLEAPSNVIRVAATDENTLSFNGIDGYQEATSDVWRVESFASQMRSPSAAPHFAFTRDASGGIDELVPGYALASFARIHPWQDPVILERILTFALGISALGLLGVAWRKRNRLAAWMLTVQGACAVLIALFIYTPWAPGGGFMLSILLAQSPPLAYLLILTNLLALCTGVLAVQGVMSARARKGQLAWLPGIHVAVAVVAGAGLLWVFAQTNLLGWHMP